ncbi:AraC family transcriptional regulator [Mycolicibacterium sp. lyk4-40-TYG-92]|uniref:AraC family transcriptional regulator n=1 Tax=Mycolicibacterium sp. lyk4-40-TYG-92 TaxID=3040295 RepID=UPI00254F7918|nr:AraC family transcriptional regulator [Mycolicibacterium sp. lyk4-40-TYG-92]
MTVIRSAVLRGFRGLVAELGGDAEQLVERVGLPREALDVDEMMTPLASQVALLRLAVAELNCPDFALRLAGRKNIAMLGTMALALKACSTLSEALECAQRYLFMHSPGIRLSLETDPYGTPGVVALRNHVPPDDSRVHRSIEHGMGFLHRSITDLAGEHYGLVSVELPFQPLAPVAVFEEFFGAPVRVERPSAILRLSSRVLELPLRVQSDVHTRHLVEALLAQRLPPGETDLLAPRVRAVIQQLLGTAPTDVTAVARMLTISPRTLQRRLSNEKTSVTILLDEVRQTAARTYLTGSDMPLTQVANLLGLSEQSALTRCCKRWWGYTPSDMRTGALRNVVAPTAQQSGSQ